MMKCKHKNIKRVWSKDRKEYKIKCKNCNKILTDKELEW